MSVIGFSYTEGMKLLRERSLYPYRIIVVKPPRAAFGKGWLRIIAEREEEEGLVVLVAYEDYE
ncbi:MAG: hypothetical protein RDV48_07760 [Candidatus Eremiobacteraeota bacterium]|nr:hypothetical protein [Candidatus Eremiobacteraeota bacterium]